QVHNRSEYLQHVISSLRKSRDISTALLIFSHDHYSDEINDIVLSVDFCPVMQIYYPYSQQLYSKEFPGEDPRDCPRDASKEKAESLNCLNKDTPDKYGHYREAKYTQTKHHWFWKLNHVFDHLEVTKLYEGLYLFIEEDHYLVEDFIHILRLMDRLRSSSCTDCNMMTLGTYDKKPKYEGIHNQVDVMSWMSSKHNMGMAFNKKTWVEIKKCGTAFCQMDDYNWDWSLHFVSLSCIPSKLKVMMMKAPRVFHIGECGLHAKGKNCNPSERVQFIEGLVAANEKYLYPRYMTISGYPAQVKKVSLLPKLNGGWGDTRDQHLCASFMEAHSHS
ncbi:hypothetical protein HELRODRAFT_89958, partial [Helobdella robusta]|uniref:Alpha-1,6-mannosyl-glycoprotein 2-beta-N-acetylglucosaminyltransferase n=1 Tax=Helobdella robusta TaxID=6412 RepID=T1G7J6_HELRO